MREVHKKGVGPARRPLYCPHANCIRSTGEGFTRRENLEEHLRRRHSYTGHYSPPPESQHSNNEDSPEQPRKRRKTVDPDSPDDEQVNQHSQYPPLSDFRRESVRSELQPMIDELLYGNGTNSDLTRDEAVRQLAFARQYIAYQRDLIREQDEELRCMDDIVKNLVPGASHSVPSSDKDFTALIGSIPAMIALVYQPDQSRIDATAPNPQSDGVAHVIESPQEMPVIDRHQPKSIRIPSRQATVMNPLDEPRSAGISSLRD